MAAWHTVLPRKKARKIQSGSFVCTIQKNGNATSTRPTEPIRYTARRPMRSDKWPNHTSVPSSMNMDTSTPPSITSLGMPRNLP
ncbi:hypothetical protein D3C87_1638110 [compost metagenome]